MKVIWHRGQNIQINTVCKYLRKVLVMTYIVVSALRKTANEAWCRFNLNLIALFEDGSQTTGLHKSEIVW